MSDEYSTRLTDRGSDHRGECGGGDESDRHGGGSQPTATTAGNEDLIEFGEAETFVVLVHFEDTEPGASVETYRQLFFDEEPGVGPSPESVTDYWEQASYGQFSLTNAPEGVAGWYELPLTESEFNDKFSDGSEASDYLWEEGIKRAKADGYAVSDYEKDMYCLVRNGGDIRPRGGTNHRFDEELFTGVVQVDAGLEMGIICHEIGHALGLAHHYYGGYYGPKVEDLPLMSWHADDSTPPSLPCAHEKNNIGPSNGWEISYEGRSSWVETTDIYLRETDETPPMLVPPAAVVDENYRFEDGPAGNGSRYLIEYRQAIGIDRNLASSGEVDDSDGLAVYYFPEETDREYPLTAGVAQPTGEPFDTTSDDIDNPDAVTQLELDNVDTAYDCVQVNDPEQRTVPDGNECVYAVPVDLDDIPSGGAAQSASDTRIDARVAWKDGEDVDVEDVSLELIEPGGTSHATSRDVDFTFDVVRSDLIDSDNAIEGGWKLRETVSVTETAAEDPEDPEYTDDPDQSPYGRSSPWPVPGRIPAEDFDEGGDGVAYSDTEEENQGGAYRDTAVDIRESGSSYAVGWIDGGEWLEYTVEAGSAGLYNIDFRVSTESGGVLAVSVDGVEQGSVSVPNTGDFNEFTTVTLSGVELSAGEQVLRVSMEDGPFDFRWFEVEEPAEGADSVEYYRAVNHPTYEMATRAALPEATVESGTLTATVELAFGDGSAYDPGGFGEPTADQFTVEVAGSSVPADDITVSPASAAGTYTLDIAGVAPSDGDSLAVSFTDEKAGATHTTNTATTGIDAPSTLGVSATGATISRGGTAELTVDATAVEAVRVEGLWTDWGVTDATAAGATVDDQVGSAGTYTFQWGSAQDSVSVSLSASLPDRYVGGEYVLTATGSASGETIRETVSVTVE